MSNLLLLILYNTNKLPELLETWRDIGVPGTTILESIGGHASRTWLDKFGLNSINKLFQSSEVQSRTLLAVFEDEKLMNKAIAEAERIVGGFDKPDSGLIFILPVSKVIGDKKVSVKPSKEVSPPALRSDWTVLRDTLVETVDSLLKLKPTIVESDTSLEKVSQAMVAHPKVHVVSVVSKDGRLIGLLELSTLVNDLFIHILPEEFLKEITSLEAVMDYADKIRTQTAGDAMIPAVSVSRADSVKVAFQKMHENKLPGIPIVDDQLKVIGYINLLELLSLSNQLMDSRKSGAVKK